MSELKHENINALGNKVTEALRKNNFQAIYCETREKAVEYITALIPPKASIGFAGSVTLQQIGLTTLFENKDYEILNHNIPGLSPEEALDIRRRQLLCDVFLTSTNAVTKDGMLVNTDGVGNRVAAMIFGPKTTVVVAGINKIVNDVHDASKRIKAIAALQNNRRLDLPNPCMKTGQCMDCSSAKRICNATTILKKKPSLSNIHVVIIGEELGY